MAAKRPEAHLKKQPSGQGEESLAADSAGFKHAHPVTRSDSASLERAQIDALYRAMGPSNASSLIANGAMGPLLWFDGVAPGPLVSFLLSCGIIAGLRHLLYLKYLKNPAAHPPKQWGLWASIGGSIAGLCWSIPAFFMLPDVSEVIALIYTFVCCLMSVSSMIVSIGYRPYTFAATSSRVIPLAAWYLGSDFPYPWLMAFALCGFLIFMLYNSSRLYQGFLASLRLQGELEALASALREGRDQSELQRQRAEMAQQMQTRFLAAVSHDLRQPMQAMMMLLATLSTHRLAPGSRDLLTKMEMSARLMRDMFEALLELSHLRSGDIKARLEAIPIGPLGDAIHTTFKNIAETKGLSLKVQLGPGELDADPELLRRALFNLVDNAVKYSSGGEIKVWDEVFDRPGAARERRHAGLHAWESAYLIHVSDQGIGIAPEHVERIFDEYIQISNRRRNRREGLGLGLAIVRRSCDLMRLKVYVHSVPHLGSVFTIAADLSRFRRQTPLPLAITPDEPVSLQTKAWIRNRQVCVLLIEDDLAVLESTAMVLRHRGFEVHCCDSAYSIDQTIQSLDRAPNVIISDYRLDELIFGTALIDRLREEFNQDIPAILVTGDTTLGNQSSLAEGREAVQVLFKPVSPDKLMESLARAIQRSPSPAQST